MVTDSHRSIGEVLALLQDDFPDVTISKIRFLESQGLITPERTSSGYRKFYEADLSRLRWILTQQKENFLPLKVIKNRLDSGDHDIDESPPAPAQPSLLLPGFEPTENNSVEEAAVASIAPKAMPEPVSVTGGMTSEPVAELPSSEAKSNSGSTSAPVDVSVESADLLEVTEIAAEPVPVAETPTLATQPQDEVEVADPQRFLSQGSALSMTPGELADSAGLSIDQVEDLERFGLISARALGPEKIYGEESLLVARLAAAFARHGIEARHLRMYKVAADREAGIFEQMLIPIARNQAAGRPVAAMKLAELALLGDGMRDAMLRQSLSPHLI
jgi:DNA-binding transcriptional MerR regulator